MMSVGEALQRIDQIRQVIYALREGLQRDRQGHQADVSGSPKRS